MNDDPLRRLEDSWTANADAWTRVVRERGIESRRLVTDAAVREAILARRPRRVLDVGCGEGWLCRELTAHGIAVTGVDYSEPLIAAARALGGGEFHHLAGADLAAAALGRFDLAVCNFALLADDVAPMLVALRQVVEPDGGLVIQTLHPWTAGGGGEYRDGWRIERFDAFGGDFGQPMPWYFRTLESWLSALSASGWRVESLHEPLHPVSGRPASLLIVANAFEGVCKMNRTGHASPA